MDEHLDLTLYEYLKDNLKVVYITVRKDETRIRCPHCGDSVKSSTSAHCYIKNTAPFPYYCQRCSSSGIANGEFLNLLNIFEADIGKYLKNSFNKYSEGINRKYGSSLLRYNNKKKQINVLPNQYTELEMRKVRYIEDRFGFMLNENLLKKFNIILNIEDFLNNNGIDINRYDSKRKYMLPILNKDYCMFLLNDKGMINCRNMNNNIDKKRKFYKFRIFEDIMNEDSRRFYSISNEIDLASRKFTIHIAEGIFDIVSVYHNVMKDYEDESTVYIANNGKGYLFVLDYIKKLGMLNCDINIYSDSDVPVNELKKKLRHSILAQMNGFKVYYNKYNEIDKSIKDFGVSADKIILSDPIEVNY